MALNPRRAMTCLILPLAVSLSSCGDDGGESGRTAGSAAAAAEGASTGKEARDRQTEDAYIAFLVDGRERRFTHMPSDKNMAMSSATMLLARPREDAQEEFAIMVMNFNVKRAELPVTLSLGLKEAMQDDGDSTAFVRAPKPLIRYVSADGVEYASYADVTFESYADGIVTGSVGTVDLSPDDTESHESIQLSDLRFRAAL